MTVKTLRNSLLAESKPTVKLYLITPWLCVLLALLVSLTPKVSYAQSCNSLSSVRWLLGDWVADDGKNITLESWKEVSPHTFEGFGESRAKITSKLRASESLRLVEMSGEVFYLAKPEQNETPVAFKLSDCSSNSAIFENALHDFPQKLDYRLTTDNKLMVTVSGLNGKGFSINFVQREGLD